MSKIKVNYVPTTQPIQTVEVKNAKGYNDLFVNKNTKGTAIRIADKYGSPARVHVTLDAVPALIEALNLVLTKGVNTSVKDVGYEGGYENHWTDRAAS